MPKKAVAIYFIAAFIGAALFIFFTFPRTKEEIPKSNNQRPFPSAPMPGDNSAPAAPEPVPHPDAAKLPAGPTLRVMAWASAEEAKLIEAQTDAFAASTGRAASLTLENDESTYRRDLAQALASATPPDVCLIAARDFSGLDPANDLAEATPAKDTAPRAIAAFTVDSKIKAAPDEFSVDLLFYNPAYFDQAGIGYPDRHWNWDIVEAITRALTSLHLKDASGQPVYPLELPANFDFWNVLCAESGHPALDLDNWHLGEPEDKESQMRALSLVHNFFQELAVTVPAPKNQEPPGRYFAAQRAALLIAPSDFTAALPAFPYRVTLLPSDLQRVSLARVNGWAVTAKAAQPDAARALAAYLAVQPVHAGWSSVEKPPEEDTTKALCYEALGQALLPRIDPKNARLVDYLNQQINLLARDSAQKPEAVYARIQAEYKGEMSAPAIESDMPQAAGLKPALLAPASPALRGP